MESCVFCKIIRSEIASKVITQNNKLIVIQDISPQAEIHYLIIPKKHIENIQHMNNEDFNLGSDIFKMAQELSNDEPKAKNFKLINNNGKLAGQVVMHLHVHFLAGKY